MIAAIGAIGSVASASGAANASAAATQLSQLSSALAPASGTASPFAVSGASPFGTSLTPFAEGTSVANPISATNAFGVSGVQSTDASLQGTNATAPTAATGSGSAGSTGSDNGFGSVLGKAIDSLAATQTNSDNLAVGAATGNTTDVHNYMIAANQADVATQLTVALRNDAVNAFQQIMNMTA